MNVKIIKSFGNIAADERGTKHPTWVIECPHCKERVMYTVAHWNRRPHGYTCERCNHTSTFTGNVDEPAKGAA